MHVQSFVDAIPIACAAFLFRFVASEAAYQRAQRTRTGLRFPVGLGLRITFRVGGPLLLFVGYKMTAQAGNAFDWVAASAVALMGAACLLSEPGQIFATPAGLVQKSVLGLVSRQIGWDGAAASWPSKSQEVLVVGKNGVTIKHTQYHVGQAEFVHELRRRHVYLQS